jgi:hypothetical protein
MEIRTPRWRWRHVIWQEMFGTRLAISPLTGADDLARELEAVSAHWRQGGA